MHIAVYRAVLLCVCGHQQSRTGNRVFVYKTSFHNTMYPCAFIKHHCVTTHSFLCSHNPSACVCFALQLKLGDYVEIYAEDDAQGNSRVYVVQIVEIFLDDQVSPKSRQQ